MDWETLYCPNRFCRYYGRSFHASLLVKNGSTRGQKQARCRSCGRTVALTYGTAYFDLDAEPADNINAIAQAKGVKAHDVTVLVMDRPRHEALIAKIRKAGAKVKLITDGDVAGVIEATDPATGVDLYLGIGGAPEGVLAAAALRCVGGQMQGRLVFRNEDEKARAAKWGIKDLNRKYKLHDLVSGDVVFSATGVTDGSMLRGVHRVGNFITTESVVMRSATGTVRWIKARHRRDLALSR